MTFWSEPSMSSTGFISELQHFSVGDGGGIRTTVFMQGCNMRCEWCHNPETIPIGGATLIYEKETCASGREMTVKDVMDYILEDTEFYEESGGGVTISGGEPLLQCEFCAALAKECRKRGINTIIDTAGNVPFACFEALIPYTDSFFFDIKGSNAADYSEKTGGDFARITRNLKELVCLGCDITVRIPVIPNYDDSAEYLETCADLLLDIGITKLALLPFHRLGSAKYNALGQTYKYAETPPLPKDKIITLGNVFENKGLSLIL